MGRTGYLEGGQKEKRKCSVTQNSKKKSFVEEKDDKLNDDGDDDDNDDNEDEEEIENEIDEWEKHVCYHGSRG